MLIIARFFRNAVKCGQLVGTKRESDAPVVAAPRRSDVPLCQVEELALLFDHQRVPACCESGNATGGPTAEWVEHAAAGRRVHPEELREKVGRLARDVACRVSKNGNQKDVRQVTEHGISGEHGGRIAAARIGFIRFGPIQILRVHPPPGVM